MSTPLDLSKISTLRRGDQILINSPRELPSAHGRKHIVLKVGSQAAAVAPIDALNDANTLAIRAHHVAALWRPDAIREELLPEAKAIDLDTPEPAPTALPEPAPEPAPQLVTLWVPGRRPRLQTARRAVPPSRIAQEVIYEASAFDVQGQREPHAGALGTLFENVELQDAERLCQGIEWAHILKPESEPAAGKRA